MKEFIQVTNIDLFASMRESKQAKQAIFIILSGIDEIPSVSLSFHN